MLHIVDNTQHKFSNLIKDDPVRPDIPLDARINDHARIFVLEEHESPAAAVCVRYMNEIPRDVDELLGSTTSGTPNVAVFYTIWSYQPGAGAKLLNTVRDYMQNEQKNINTYVTLSPPTEMARRFHLKNGAEIYRTNETTVNYLYR